MDGEMICSFFLVIVKCSQQTSELMEHHSCYRLRSMTYMRGVHVTSTAQLLERKESKGNLTELLSLLWPTKMVSIFVGDRLLFGLRQF